jgi:tetratricopeptide (TPR) repeat protein
MSRKRPRHKNRSGKMFRPSAPLSVVEQKSSAVSSKPTGPVARRNKILGLAVGIVVGLVLVCGIRSVLPGKKAQSGREAPTSTSASAPQGTITFNRDVAPIVFQKCAGCHRPGQSAPFALLTYPEVKKHARQIAEVTQRRYMPPWLPESGYGEFAFDRRLGTDQIAIIQQWVTEGAVEGDPTDLPPPPRFPERWQLGEPDLVVTLPQAYTLPGEGRDVYRNFVVPIPVPSLQYVKGVEFLPGNAKVVHHAFINVDETRQSRRLAEQQNPPGFDGMELPESAIMPGGQLLGWQPGKVPSLTVGGLSWVLKTNMDLVLQMHLHPSGRLETVQPTVGFYFTDQAPTNVPFRIKLARFDFEIPAGAANYMVEQSYLLPVDVSLLRVLPHAHYLGKDLQGYALLSSGKKRWLIWIRNWDFNWQGDYQYAQPVFLPKGTRLVMHYLYDNSTNNLRNPNSPPKPLRHGLQTTDEMAGLVFQAVARNSEDRSILAKDYSEYFVRVSMDYYRFLLKLNAEDATAHIKLGRALVAQGQASEGITHLLSAIRINPYDDKGHYELGYVYLLEKRLKEAYQEFQTVIRLNPGDHQAFGSLGWICLAEGRLSDAQVYLETALRLNPDDFVAEQNLRRLKAMK